MAQDAIDAVTATVSLYKHSGFSLYVGREALSALGLGYNQEVPSLFRTPDPETVI